MFPLSPDQSTVKRPGTAALLFAALGDETRLRLVARLSREGPLSIASLTGGTNVSRQAVTKHLQILAGTGIASSTKHGRERLWQLDPRRLMTAREYLDDLSSQWDRSLGRLKQMVEGQEA